MPTLSEVCARSIRLRSRGECIASQRSLRRCTLSQKSGLLPNTRAENESGCRGHVAAIVAQLIDVLALYTHGVGQRALRQADRLHEFLDQNFANRRRLAFCQSTWLAIMPQLTSRYRSSVLTAMHDTCRRLDGSRRPRHAPDLEVVRGRCNRGPRRRSSDVRQALLDRWLDVHGRCIDGNLRGQVPQPIMLRSCIDGNPHLTIVRKSELHVKHLVFPEPGKSVQLGFAPVQSP